MDVRTAGNNRCFHLHPAMARAVPMLAVLLLLCDNPFFPSTGTPPVVKGPRSTPQGVIHQLINAYENKRIDLYRELFSSARDFRFYVSKVFAEDNSPDGYKAKFARPCELVDTMCQYIKSNINDSCFFYLTYDEEMQAAEGLFQKSTQITYQGSPTFAAQTRYIVNGNGDTTHVEVVMRGGTITVVGIPDYADPYQPFAYEYPIDIQEQVFYLERDPDSPDFWVIQKWFDLGTATGN